MWQALTDSLLPEHELTHPNRVHVEHALASDVLSRSLSEHMSRIYAQDKLPIIIVCIGTDRSTGDSLGPLIGTSLQERVAGLPVSVYGTLEEPVHAANLAEVLVKIQTDQPGKPMLAIDACLGRSENVGYISVKQGPLRPGTGVNKKLPAVGDLHIVGVVNVGGFMEYFVLQNTRLSLVMRMASVITDSIIKFIRTQCLAPVAATSVYPDNMQV